MAEEYAKRSAHAHFIQETEKVGPEGRWIEVLLFWFLVWARADAAEFFSSVHSTLHFSLFLRQWQTRHNVSTSDTDKDTLLSHLCSSSITERNDSPISSLSNEEKGQKVCYSSTYKYIHMSIYHHEKNLGFYSCTLEDTIP